MQQMKKMNKDNYTLDDILEIPELRAKFPSSEFPKFEKTADGLFFQPVGRVVSTTHILYVKWFSLDKNLQISHDHSYPFVRIIPNGYLMKISVPRTADYISDFEVNYITPVDNIQVSESINPSYTSEITDNHGAVELLNVLKFNTTDYPSLVPLFTDREGFINEYLKDILYK
jgi:hypothetical protein